MKTYFYQQLNGLDQKVYDEIVNGLNQGNLRIAVSSFGSVKKVAVDIFNNYPQYFWIASRVRAMRSLLKTVVQFDQSYSVSDIRKYQNQIKELMQKFISENINDHQTDYDKVLILHDYLKNSIEYDHQAAAHVNDQTNRYVSAYNIVGALIKHKCVCDGFAKAMKYLCDQIGIECYVVNGIGSNVQDSGPHAWNIVNIDGCYQHVDVTWDNQFMDDNFPLYAYLNLDDKTIARDHSWDRRLYPACTSLEYNYFKINNALIDSKAQLKKFLIDSFSLEEDIIQYRVDKDSKLASEIFSCYQEITQEAIQACKYVRVGDIRTQYQMEQLVFTVVPKYVD